VGASRLFVFAVSQDLTFGTKLEDIGQFLHDHFHTLTFQEYMDDRLKRYAVERGLGMVGEAVVQLRATAPELEGKLPDARDIRRFRNVLVHGYFALKHEAVFAILTDELPSLVEKAKELLALDPDPLVPED
jgi:uncharacterized protein with HEPN domain